VWKAHRSLTLTPSETGDSFRSILAYLTAQLIPEAIDLQAKIAQGWDGPVTGVQAAVHEVC